MLTSLLAVLSATLSFLYSTNAWLQITGLFSFRFFATVGYNFYGMVKYEVFPTQIRSIAWQVCSVGYLLAIVVCPPL